MYDCVQKFRDGVKYICAHAQRHMQAPRETRTDRMMQAENADNTAPDQMAVELIANI